MNGALFAESLRAFHVNAINALVYNFTSNWCLILLIAAAVLSVVLGVTDQSAGVMRDEQNIL